MPEFTQEQLLQLQKDVYLGLLRWHDVPSEEVADTVMGELYDKYVVMFGIDPFEGIP